MAKKGQKLEVTAEARSVTGRAVKRLRTEGMLPVVLYGKGVSATNLQVPTKAFEKAFKEAGESTLIYLNVGSDSYPTIIKDVAREPVSGAFVHADFYKVSLTEKIKANVSVVFIGESPAVKDLGGIFVRNANELEVEAFPQDLPHEIAVDISGLMTLNSSLTVGDIKGHGWTLTGAANEVIASVTEPISEEELKASLEEPTTDVSAVEEIKKEKVLEEGEEGTAEAASAPAAEVIKE
jgi:large subunit ribosomal protein L25